MILFFVFKLNILNNSGFKFAFTFGGIRGLRLCILQPVRYPIIYLRWFFNELFIYFVVVAFSLFGTSKELIGDSQRFCSFARLWLKSQDNISKQAAVEKKLLTLEKDKEEQSK